MTPCASCGLPAPCRDVLVVGEPMSLCAACEPPEDPWTTAEPAGANAETSTTPAGPVPSAEKTNATSRAAAEDPATSSTSSESTRSSTSGSKRRIPIPKGAKFPSGAPHAATSVELGRVHLGNCLDLLGQVDRESVAMVFADLPYGITANAWDTPIDLARLWPALYRVCRPNAALVFTAVQPFASDLVQSNRADFRFEMIWKKNLATGFLNAAKRPLRNHENILVFWREEPIYQPQKTTGHPLVRVTPSQRAQAKHSKNYGDQDHLMKTLTYESSERYPTTVLDLDVVEQHDPSRRHPTQKPEALADWFIRTYTTPGDLVLDPTAGSGSTLCAARSLGRRCIGFDIDPEAVRKANDMLASRLAFCGVPA
jgi:site-specific DNA-methyltransferase (adenine-specific)